MLVVEIRGRLCKRFANEKLMERNEVFFVIVHLLCSFHLLFKEVFRFLLRFYFVVVPLKNLFREFNFVFLKNLDY